MKENAVVLTEGSIPKKITSFAMPIFWGNLFQQLYNVVDSLFVGNYVGKSGLGAVTSTASLIFLLVGLFSGMFMGAGVVISKYYGALSISGNNKYEEHDKSAVSDTIHTSIAFALLCGGILTVVGPIATPSILKLMQTPPTVLPEAITYVKIYFLGILSVILFNTASGIFSAIGNSKKPLYFLIISSISNIILDYIFVAKLSFGVEGAAYATIISQGISAFLGFYYLMKTNEVYKVSLNKIKFHKEYIGEILKMGIPSGIQNSVIAIANIVVQSSINIFGDSASAGCGSYSKLEGFAFIPITSFSLALTTFISQNLGAKQYDRAKKGAKFGILISLLLAETVGVIFFAFPRPLISLFNGEADVIAFGVTQMRTESLFFFLLAFSHSMAGILRGSGKSIVPMAVMLICWCIIRVTYVTLMLNFIHDIRVVFWAYPLTWSLSSILFTIYYKKSDWVHGLE